jgi:hypothetical protein
LAILRENPILAGAVAAIATIVLIVIIRAIVGRRVEADTRMRGRPGNRRLEPGFNGDRLDDALRRSDYQAAPSRTEPRRGGGFRTFVVFLLGIAVGYGAFALGESPEVVTRVRTVAANMLSSAARSISEPTAPARREAPGEEEGLTPKGPGSGDRAPERPVPEARKVDPVEPPAGDREAQLASFVGRMRDQLPKQVDDTTSLVRVDREGDVVSLGFSLTGVIPPELIENITDLLRNRFNGNVCDPHKPSDIRALNDAGVTFHIVYSDQVGTTVARLDVPPGYCARSG